MVPLLLPPFDPFDKGRHFGSPAERSGASVVYQRAHHAVRATNLAVVDEQIAQLDFGPEINNFGRGPGRPLIHPHVERTIVVEAEAAFGFVQLRGADPQIEEDDVKASRGLLRKLGQFMKVKLRNGEPTDCQFGSKLASGVADGRRILIDRDDLGCRECLEKRPRMSPAPESAIENPLRIHLARELQDLFEQNGFMHTNSVAWNLHVV